MILSLVSFSIIGVAIIWWTGRTDTARDPRLTLSIILGLLIMPICYTFLPKASVLPLTDTPILPAQNSFPFLSLIWITGTVLLIARICLDAFKIRSLKKGAQQQSSYHFATAYHHHSVDTPFVSGIFRPCLFLPTNWAEWSKDTQVAVLEHEAAHIKRRDPLWRTLTALACAVYWWNPLVWWLARRLVIQSELACDEAVIQKGGSASDYAHLLCNLAESSQSPLNAAAIGSSSFLKQRVQRLIAPGKALGAIQISCLIMLSGITALGLSILRQKQAPAEAAKNYPQWDVEIRQAANPFPAD